MGRSNNDEGDLHVMNKSRQQMICPEERGGIYRFENDSIKVIGLLLDFFLSFLFCWMDGYVYVVCVSFLVFIDVDREVEDGNSSSLHLASFQGPDNGEILSRIDLLKKNAVTVSSGNQPQRDEAHEQQQKQPSLIHSSSSLYHFASSRMVTMSPPATTKTPDMSSGQQRVSATASLATRRGREADENRAKLLLLLPSSRQVKLPETLEATSLLETETG
jgi:hypothetical protein